MRITNNIILHNTTGNINGNKVNVNNLNNQMTSQKKDSETFRESAHCGAFTQTPHNTQRD